MIHSIKASGGIMPEEDLIYYPLGNFLYACNYNGDKFVGEATPYKEEDKRGNEIIKYWYIQHKTETFKFEDMPIGKKAPYRFKITQKDIDEWLNPERKKQEISELYCQIKSALIACYDFISEKDADIAALFILQSWYCDLLEAVFYVDIKSRMGGGKTLLLEIFQELCRYGILSNDLSYAAIPRICDRYKATLLFDEIDSLHPNIKDEIFKMLRVGYKKGSKYIRLKPKTFEEECFEVYSAKAFNYRSDVADDLKNRSLSINTSKSNDKRLPFISLYKNKYLNKLFIKIWFFYMDSMPIINKINRIINLTINNTTEMNRATLFHSSVGNLLNLLIEMPDNSKYRSFTHEMTVNHLNELFAKINGRNIELLTLLISLTTLLELEVWEDFKSVFEDKEEFEDFDGADTKALLQELLIKIWKERSYSIHPITNQKFIPYRMLSAQFLKMAYEGHSIKPPPNEVKKQLREIGFVDKVNRKVMTIKGESMLCLIYDSQILHNINQWDGTDRRKEVKPVNEERRKHESH